MNSEGKQKSNQSFNPTRASVILGLPVLSSQSSYEYIHMYIHTYIYISICKPPTQLRLRNAFNHFICFHPPSSSSDAAPSLGLLGGTFAAAVKCFIYPALMTPLRIGLSESDTHIPIYIYMYIYPSPAVAFASYEAVVCFSRGHEELGMEVSLQPNTDKCCGSHSSAPCFVSNDELCPWFRKQPWSSNDNGLYATKNK